ncbi:MAG: hypothetical protein VYC40_00095, partial [Pseudomonadota bacterium]|nr:hypothetical protein [Pseudomonadota bacterium]
QKTEKKDSRSALCFAMNNRNKDMMHALLEKDNVCYLKEHDIASKEDDSKICYISIIRHRGLLAIN